MARTFGYRNLFAGEQIEDGDQVIDGRGGWTFPAPPFSTAPCCSSARRAEEFEDLVAGQKTKPGDQIFAAGVWQRAPRGMDVPVIGPRFRRPTSYSFVRPGDTIEPGDLVISDDGDFVTVPAPTSVISASNCIRKRRWHRILSRGERIMSTDEWCGNSTPEEWKNALNEHVGARVAMDPGSPYSCIFRRSTDREAKAAECIDHCKAVMEDLNLSNDPSSKSFLIDSIDRLAGLVKKYESQIKKMKEALE